MAIKVTKEVTVTFTDGRTEVHNEVQVQPNGWVHIPLGGRDFDLVPAVDVARIEHREVREGVSNAIDRSGYHKLGQQTAFKGGPVPKED